MATVFNTFQEESALLDIDPQILSLSHEFVSRTRRHCNVLHVFIATINTLELLAKQLRRKSLVTRSTERCIPVSMQQYSER